MAGVRKFEYQDQDISIYYENSLKAKHSILPCSFPVMLHILFNDHPNWQLFNIPGNYTFKKSREKSKEFLRVNISTALAKELIPTGHPLWDNFRDNIQKGRFTSINVHALPVTPAAKQLVYSMINKRFAVAGLAEFYTRAKVLELFPLLLEQLSFQEFRSEASITEKELALVNKATQFMEDISGGTFTIKSLAAAVETNETTLKYAFKKIHGLTIYKYYQQIRMAKANHLLREGRSVTQVAALSGYSSISHFTYAYKKIFGDAPTYMHSTPY